MSTKLRISFLFNLVLLTIFCLSILLLGGGNNLAGTGGDEVENTSLFVSGRLPTITPGAVLPSNPEDEFVQTSRRIIIKSATLTIVVKNPSSKLDEITLWTESSGGWIVSSVTSGTEEDQTVYLKIRVPAERFQEAVTL